MHHGGIFRHRRIYPPSFSLRLGHARALTPHRGVIHSPRAASLPDKRACRSSGGVYEVVITRRSWKFASIAVAKTRKSLVNTDFSGTSETSQKRISKNISKKIEYLMISAKAVSYTEGYRSGHNEAVLKTVCPLDTWVRISHPPPSKSLENTTFSRLFSFCSFPNLNVLGLISRIFLTIFR